MAELTQANRSQNVTKQMKQKKFSLLVSSVIICALLLPVRVIGRLQHPEIKANWLKTWMLSDTTYLGFRPLLLYFLPQLPDFRTKETPELKFRLRFFFVRSQIAVKSSSRMRNLLALTHAWRLTNEHMAWCNGGRREAFAVQNQHRHCV